MTYDLTGWKQYVRLALAAILIGLLWTLSRGGGRAAVPLAPAAVSFVDSGQNLGGDGQSRAVALGDLDGDGDLDAVVIADDSAPQIWLNDGRAQEGTEGVFVDSGQALGTDAALDVALADLDGDDDVDVFLLVSSLQSGNRVWINQGGAQGGDEGNFEFSDQTFGGLSTAVALGDLDRDGDVDAFVARESAPSKVWLNDGNGFFVGEGLDAPIPGVDVALADLDGDGILDQDGDLDVFSAMDGVDKANRVGINQGGAQCCVEGVFEDSNYRLGEAASQAVALGDLDGDGDVDVLVANLGANKIWVNSGGAQGGTEGDWQHGSELEGGSSGDVALADVDGDGDLDAFVANSGANRVWVNQGGPEGGAEGTLVDSGLTLGTAVSEGLALGDVDGDGDVDAFVANFGAPDKVWLNESDSSRPGRHFVRASQYVIDYGTYSQNARLGDLDGDGDLDLALRLAAALGIMLNDGSAEFSSHESHPLPDNYRSGLAVGDLDGDNDLDIAVSGEASTFLNDGAGNFSAGPPLPYDGRWFVPGDFDADGDLDLLTSGPPGEGLGSVHLLLNQGGRQGGAEGRLLDGGARFEDVYFVNRIMDTADVDGDGDLDVVIDAHGEANERERQLWLNQGGAQGGDEGDLAFGGQVLGGAGTEVVLGDLDGDGDPDAVVARRDFDDEAGGPPNEVWLNVGGAFSDSGQRLGAESTRRARLGDVDLDGDLDLVALNEDNSRVWLNSGGWQGGDAGTFVPGEALLAYDAGIITELGDLDGDGYPDGISGQGGVRRWLNRPTPVLGSAGFLYQNLPANQEGSLIYDWWHNTNALLPVALRESLPVPAEIAVDTDRPVSDRDLLQFPAGELVDFVTAGANQTNGEAERIWNPYFGASPGFDDAVGVGVELLASTNLAVAGSEKLIVVFHNPDAPLRTCFLEGVEFLVERLLQPEARMARPNTLPTSIDLDLFRAVRDDVMAQTLQGHYYTGLYETHSPELLQITTRNLNVLGEIGRGLETWSPLLQALVDGDGDTVTITPAMVAQAEFILDIYAAEASPELAATIAEERAALDLPAFAGLTMDEALARVNERELESVYLPAVAGD